MSEKYYYSIQFATSVLYEFDEIIFEDLYSSITDVNHKKLAETQCRININSDECPVIHHQLLESEQCNDIVEYTNKLFGYAVYDFLQDIHDITFGSNNLEIPPLIQSEIVWHLLEYEKPIFNIPSYPNITIKTKRGKNFFQNIISENQYNIPLKLPSINRIKMCQLESNGEFGFGLIPISTTKDLSTTLLYKLGKY